MPARLFYDADCPLDPLKGKTLVFVGYGNQGRAQALNIVGKPVWQETRGTSVHPRLTLRQRDTLKSESISPPPRIVIANNKDSYSSAAEEDGFGFTADWRSAAAEADILFLLVPDQVGLENTMQLAVIDPPCSRFSLNCSTSFLPRP
jgi:hypothetical protein